MMTSVSAVDVRKLARASLATALLAEPEVLVLDEPTVGLDPVLRRDLPAVVFPQLLLCGLFVPRHRMATVLQGISDALPLTYAFDALQRAAVRGALGARGELDIAVIVGATLLAMALGAATLRRRSP